jgi:polysaccharide export outer membrane protein
MLTRTALSLVFAALISLAPATAGAADEYTIGPGDLLRIVVWSHDDLSRDYPVLGDGSLPFPLLGRVNADGLTAAQVAQSLRILLDKDYLVDPHVIVLVVESAGSGNGRSSPRPPGFR